jgi:hypothetical protein
MIPVSPLPAHFLPMAFGLLPPPNTHDIAAATPTAAPAADRPRDRAVPMSKVITRLRRRGVNIQGCQRYFLTAAVIAVPALARSSGTITG